MYICACAHIMEDLQNKETGVHPRRRTVLKRIVKLVLWIAGTWAILLTIMQFALSPSVLEKVVDRFAPEYIDGRLEFDRIKVNMFRHFPNVGIVLENGSLTYPADRFDRLEAAGAQGRLLYHGCGETTDTLASFRHFSAGINIAALAAGKIRISHVVLGKPRIFAHSYDSGNANWNIFRMTEDMEEPDTASRALPHIAIGRIRLTDHPHIVYTDSRDTLFAMIDVKRIAFDGRLDTRRSSKNRIGLSFDSMMVAGRLAADTIGLGMDRLHIHEHHDHMDIHAEAKALIATRAFGRIRIPISINGTASLPNDTVPAIAMNGFMAEIASIPIGFNMTLRKEEAGLGIDGDFSIDGCRVEDLIDDFVKNIIPESKDISTDATFSLSGTCSGRTGSGELPAIDVSLTVPESSVGHKDLMHDIHLTLDAGIRTDNDKKLNVSIHKAGIKTYGLRLTADGGLSDIMGEDPLIRLDGNFRASADSLLTFLPEDSGITATGELSASLKGSIRMSQMDIYNFGNADLTGSLHSNGLVIRAPEDTIDISVKGMDISIAPEVKTSRKDTTATFRLLGISGNITSANISLKETMYVEGEQVSFAAKNSVEALSGRNEKKIHPLGGHLDAAKIVLKDGNGMSVALSNTANGFQMIPKTGQPEIPVLTLNSRNKRIYARSQSSRIILTDAKFRAGAAMNSIERRLKRKAFMDSLASAHPEIPRDSLMAHLRARRTAQPIPEWMTEEDFKSRDLNFSLDGIVAEYFRKWDLWGDIDVRTGIIMTPRLPLRNILKGMDISFNNNEVSIDSFKMVSGSSEIAAKGSLGGLRRALLGRGTYSLDMDLMTERMNANELLAAFNAGAKYDEEEHGGQLEAASDSEFLKMVVSDSLETESLNTLLIVPADLNADIRLNASGITFSDLLINEIKADVIMKERCMQIVNSSASTNIGKAEFEGFYATRTKNYLKTGFNLNLTDITSEKVIAMMPAIDTIMPLLKSFKGQIDCELAATADLDTCMNIIPPSINGVIRIKGEDLTMSDNDMFRNLAQKLKFKNRNEARIDRMTVEGLIKDNTLEVFPFVLELDRYTLALSGLQNLDLSYKYHASIIHSPILFKVGVDIYGPDFDNMKFKIGKPKYKTTDVPVFSAVIDQTKINLAESIRGIFEKGVELAVRENEMQKAITDRKREIGYVNAAEQQIVELTEEERRKFEEESREMETAMPVDSLSINRTLNEIISKDIK